MAKNQHHFHSESFKKTRHCEERSDVAINHVIASAARQSIFLIIFSLFLRIFPNLLPKKAKFFVNYSMEILFLKKSQIINLYEPLGAKSGGIYV